MLEQVSGPVMGTESGAALEPVSVRVSGLMKAEAMVLELG